MDCSTHGCCAPLPRGPLGLIAATWLSSKIIALKTLRIFPAAAFVEMAIEAGVQLFEGRPFVIEDFEIRKPLILPDPAVGIVAGIGLRPGGRTFTIQSRLEQGVAWSVHVVGSIRGERTDSAFASSAWSGLQSASLHPVEINGFYNHLSDLGLRYGEEFRPIRELAAGGGRSAGRVSLSEKSGTSRGRVSLAPCAS